MLPAVTRRLAAVVLVALVVVLAAGAGVTASRISGTGATPLLFARTISDPPSATTERRLAQGLPDWPGGAVTASTGETLNVFVSPSLPTSSTQQTWAEFIAHLTHGPEISKLNAYFGTLEEVQELCGTDQALGCYGDDDLVAPAQLTIDGVDSQEIVRHEYGHHIAFNRLNPPWSSVEWGPKYWASTAGICQRVTQGSAFPGDELVHYRENPGEAWAETYRLMDERKNGISTQSWDIVSPAFFPNDADYAAAEQDVVQPWSGTHAAKYQKRFTRSGKKVWLVPLQTPLDGTMSVSAVLPKGATSDVALLSGNGKTVLRHASLVRARTKQLTATVCGRRSLYVRVTAKGAPGLVSVTTSLP